MGKGRMGIYSCVKFMPFVQSDAVMHVEVKDTGP